MSIKSNPLLVKDFLSLTTGIVADINALVELNEHGMEYAEQETRMLASQAQRHSVLFLCATIVLIIILSYRLSCRVARPIRQLAHNAWPQAARAASAILTCLFGTMTK